MLPRRLATAAILCAAASAPLQLTGKSASARVPLLLPAAAQPVDAGAGEACHDEAPSTHVETLTVSASGSVPFGW